MRTHISRTGLLWMLAATIVGGGAVGLLAYLASTFAFVAVLYPLAMAFAGDGMLRWAITRGKVRSALVAAVFGLTLGLLIFGTYHYQHYLSFKDELEHYVAYQLESELESMPLTEGLERIHSTAQNLILRWAGSSGFWGYLKGTARGGVELWRWFGTQNGFTVDLGERFNPFAVWFYRGLELATVAGLTLVGATVAAGRPYCERCDDWVGDEPHICPGSEDLATFVQQSKSWAQRPSYGGFRRRGAALLIDAALCGFATLPLGSLVWCLAWIKGVFGTGIRLLEGVEGAGNAFWVCLPICAWLYFALQESSPRQATLGKMALRLCVADLQGKRISFWRATARHWAKLLSALTLGLGFIVCELSPQRRALHDYIAGTVVMHTGG